MYSSLSLFLISAWCSSNWQYHVYYPEETTDGANTWTVIEEIHSFYFKVKCWWALFGCWINSS